METDNKKPTNQDNRKNNMPRFSLSWLYWAIGLMLLTLWFTNENGMGAGKEVSYDEFQDYVK